MRNGPRTISMFRLGGVAAAILLTATLAKSAHATPIFATEADLTAAFGSPTTTLDWQAVAPIPDFASGAPFNVNTYSVFTLPTIGDVRISHTGAPGGTQFQRKVAGLAESGVLDAVHAFPGAFPGAFTPGSGDDPANSTQLLQIFDTGILFEFLDGPIGGFGTTLQTNSGGGTPESTSIQAFSSSGNLISSGPDTSAFVSSPGDLGSTSFLGASSATNEITSIFISTTNNNFAINNPTFFMNSTATGVPEPGTWLMMGLGTFLYGAGRRRKKKSLIIEDAV